MKTAAETNGKRQAITASTAIQAKILQKRRKENERIRESSVTSSISPTKNSIGPWKPCLRALKLKYLLSCRLGPKAMKPRTCVTITETSASANVRLRSLVPGRTQDISLSE